MPMNVNTANVRIAREVQEAEHALNDALLKQALLFTTMMQARKDTDSDPFTGHEALLRLTRSQQSLLAAGGDLSRVHGKLLQVQKEITGYDDCPPNKPMAFMGSESGEAVASIR